MFFNGLNISFEASVYLLQFFKWLDPDGFLL